MNSEKERRYLSGEKDLPIVLVHGTMGKSEDWSRVVEELSNSRSVIRPDYIERATGTNSTNELAIRDLADEVVAAVRAEGKQRFDLVGCSLGAAIATCIAAEYPEMVRSLVLVSGFSHGSDPRMNLQFKLWLRLASTDKVAFTKLLLVSGLSPVFLSAFDEPTLNGITENFIASTNWRPVEPTIRVDLSVDVREYAARITSPTLLITAKHDQIVPPAYSENLVPDAKTLELDSGHLIFLEKPVELASAILSFCPLQQDYPIVNKLASCQVLGRAFRRHAQDASTFWACCLRSVFNAKSRFMDLIHFCVFIDLQVLDHKRRVSQ